MTRLVQIITGLVVLAALGWLGFNWYAQRQAPLASAPFATMPGDAALIPPPAAAAAPATPADEELSFPGEKPPANSRANPPATAPLVGLAESDPKIVESLRQLLDLATLQKYFQLESLARKFVLCVDNLPAGKLAPQNRVVKPVPGNFKVIETDQEIVLNEENYQRYAPLIDALTSLPVAQIARVYREFYPLLQQAYEDLGYPGQVFNDRLLAVIDHLLIARPPQAPVLLAQPKVFYRYADPTLEEASVGHKILFRIGPAQMASVQTWLRAVRVEVAAGAPRSP